MRLARRYFFCLFVVVTTIILYMTLMLPINVVNNNKSRYTYISDVSNTVISENLTLQTALNERLIDSYGKNDLTKTGEMGRGVILAAEEKQMASGYLAEYNINVVVSDLIPLNRMVPDSRHAHCKLVEYPDDLPTASIVIPFYNEWPSILLRTVYSVINRTPKNLLKEIILVDDASTLETIQEELSKHIDKIIPKGLVKLVRMETRVGLIRTRLEGFKLATGDVVSFFDSHMEVNVDWLQPLLMEIKKNKSTIAMANLDYIGADTFEYTFYGGRQVRYAFDWRLKFFENYFRKDQVDPKLPNAAKPGVVMVGAAFVINVNYFKEIGMYDEGMKIWGGENFELSWRVWMCGGSLMHVPCSHIGHIARVQPYSFPDGRRETELYNYKRAVDVWLGDYKKYAYSNFPNTEFDSGDISERLAIKDKLKCKDFSWYLKNIFPELLPYEEDAFSWGGLQLKNSKLCLDNHKYLFAYPEKFGLSECTGSLPSQGFSWTHERQLRTTLQCVARAGNNGVVIQACADSPSDTWTHMKDGYMRHISTGMCLEYNGEKLLLETCVDDKASQMWTFTTYKKSYYDMFQPGNSKT